MSPLVGIVGAALLAGGGLALVVFGWRQSRRTGVDRLRAAIDADIDATSPEISALAQAWTAMTAATERAGKGGSVLVWLGGALERAGWPLRPSEFGIGVAAAAGVVGILVAGILGNVAVGILAGMAVGIVPVLVLGRQASILGRKADRQLPDVLGQLAASLRSGHSLNQAIEAAGDQTAAPLGPQMARVVAETQVGRSLEDALAAMAERVGSTDLRWSVRAMMIQSRTGGKLSDVLEVLAEFMRDREEVRREVQALTADGRMSAWILGLLPFFVLGALLVVSREYLTPLVTDPMGFVMIGAAAVLMAVGMLWIRKIIRVEV